MQQTITKYFCDYCMGEVSMTEYLEGVKLNIRVNLANPKGGAGQVAGVNMNLCKKCSEDLGIINKQEYHAYTYSQGKLRSVIEKVKIKIVNMIYKKV